MKWSILGKSPMNVGKTVGNVKESTLERSLMNVNYAGSVLVKQET